MALTPIFRAIVKSEVGATSEVIVNVTDPPSTTDSLSTEIFKVGFCTAGRKLEPLEVGTDGVTIKAAVFDRPTE